MNTLLEIEGQALGVLGHLVNVLDLLVAWSTYHRCAFNNIFHKNDFHDFFACSQLAVEVPQHRDPAHRVW